MTTEILPHPDNDRCAFVRTETGEIRAFNRCAMGHLIDDNEHMFWVEGWRRWVCRSCASDLADQIACEVIGMPLDEVRFASVPADYGYQKQRPRASIPKDIRHAVHVRDAYRCRYCGGFAGGLQLDHVQPVVQGGDNSIENLVTSCVPCNSFKSGRTPEQAGMPLLPIGAGA